MLYALLIIIAIGVLLVSNEGKSLLGLISILALVGGLLFLAFWAVMIVVAFFTSDTGKSAIDILGEVVNGVIVALITCLLLAILINLGSRLANKFYNKFKNLKRAWRSWFSWVIFTIIIVLMIIISWFIF